MLTRLYVNNFRCMVNFECQFGPQQLILGSNGTGKSTLFEILAMLRDACVRAEPLDGRFLGKTRTRWSDIAEQEFELDVAGNDGSYHFRLVIDSWGKPLERPRILMEEVTFNGQPVFRFENGEVHLFNDRHEDKVQYPFDWHRSALAMITERADNTRLSWFKRWLGGLLIVSPDPRRMSGVAVQEARSADQYLSNYADWFRHVRQELNDYEYIKDLTEVIEGFVSMRLENAGEGRREVKMRIGSTGQEPGQRGEAEYTLGELSDGQRVLLGLYAVLHFAMTRDSTVCFDEPDNFIALREVQPWLTKVLDRAEGEDDNGCFAQVFIVSHHPELLNRMAFQEGIVLDRPNGQHTRASRFEDHLQTGLTPADLIARGWDRE